MKIHDQITEYLRSLTGIQNFYVCPHDATDFCTCRKPQPGLIQKAAFELEIDLVNSFMIGDRKSDIEASRSAGCKAFYIDRGYLEPKPEQPYTLVNSLLDFAHKL